jgi:general secretion pathway protein D
VTIFVKNVSFKEALNLIMTTNNLFMKKISDDTILIIPKTKQKVDQYQDLLIRTFYLSNTKAEDMVNLLRTMLETRRVFVNKELNSIVIRDTPEKVKLAEKIIMANDRMVAEVMFNVEVLEVLQTDQLRYGWRFNNSQITGGIGQSDDTANTIEALGIISLDTLRSDYTWFFTVPNVIVDFLKTEGEAKILANPRIRVLDNKQAKVNIGDKVPILLSTTTTSVPTTGVAQSTSTATNIEFKDVGIKLTVKPKVDLSNDVTLELNLEVTSLGDRVDLGGGTSQFRFGNRTAETTLNVKNGETVVIGGLIRDEDRVNYNKIPGLGDIPLLGKLFSSTDKRKEKTDIILTITPTVVRGLEAPERDLQYFWSGTEDTYSTKPLFSELPTTGEVRSDQMPPFMTPDESAPPSVTPPIPPSFVPPTPLPPVPGLPTPSTLPRRSSQPDLSEPTPTVVIQPQEVQIPVTQEVTVGVMVNNVSQLSEAALSLAYDPKVLQFRRVTEGDLMGKDGRATSFVSSTDPSTGQVEVYIKRLSDLQGVTGSGTLLSLVFSGKGSGASTIALKE